MRFTKFKKISRDDEHCRFAYFTQNYSGIFTPAKAGICSQKPSESLLIFLLFSLIFDSEG